MSGEGHAVGRPYTSWVATLKNDLARHNLTLKDAIELALNKPLWRLLAASGATHWWCMPNNDDDVPTTHMATVGVKGLILSRRTGYTSSGSQLLWRGKVGTTDGGDRFLRCRNSDVVCVIFIVSSISVSIVREFAFYEF